MTVEPRIAVAIDFGTHASGFAWTVMSRLNDDLRTAAPASGARPARDAHVHAGGRR